ncbi:PadR family transcriptional regulator [Chakrabartyella piscis]|uniref:PadR family transcriptional regulator n=1 Tax=Chakrabartyella piscis TaxID=2918914 RepID=UPI00295869B9|nr:PadR family transcriptional regulator [Chakrabartyella piscis]
MAREKYQTLTEQMFYILLCLEVECCGVDIMKMVSDLTGGRVVIGAGTLYTLLDNFQKEKFIAETKVENRKKSYLITNLGKELLEKEYKRLQTLTADYEQMRKGNSL